MREGRGGEGVLWEGGRGRGGEGERDREIERERVREKRKEKRKKEKERKEDGAFQTILAGVYSQGDWENCPRGEVHFTSSQIHSMSVSSSLGEKLRTTLQAHQKAQGLACGHRLNIWFKILPKNQREPDTHTPR